MPYWYFKSEPETWSWKQQVAAGSRGEPWDGVRNHQAAGNIRAMQVGDLALFYHSGRAREFVGVVRVTRASYPDRIAPEWPVVDVAAMQSLTQPVSLRAAKDDPVFEGSPLTRQSRLSVGPLTTEQFQRILTLSKTELPNK